MMHESDYVQHLHLLSLYLTFVGLSIVLSSHPR